MCARYAAMFENLRREGRGAFIPFVTLGDPCAARSEVILNALAASGADALELGIPFSDPVADGPVIQASAQRALESGATPDDCFAIIRRTRERHPALPIGLLVYANLVIGGGAENFYRKAAGSGADSVLIADVPSLASAPFAAAAREAGIDHVCVAPPNADDGKLREIASISRGYVYFMGRAGVTGADREMSAPARRRMELLKSAGSPPVVIGFGVSRPEHVRAAVSAGADGAISGSAVVSIISSNLDDDSGMINELSEFVGRMSAASRARE